MTTVKNDQIWSSVDVGMLHNDANQWHSWNSKFFINNFDKWSALTWPGLLQFYMLCIITKHKFFFKKCWGFPLSTFTENTHCWQFMSEDIIFTWELRCHWIVHAAFLDKGGNLCYGLLWPVPLLLHWNFIRKCYHLANKRCWNKTSLISVACRNLVLACNQ